MFDDTPHGAPQVPSGLAGLTRPAAPTASGFPQPPVAPPSAYPAAAPAATAAPPAYPTGALPALGTLPTSDLPVMPPVASADGVRDVEVDSAADSVRTIYLDELLEHVVKVGSSDLHLSAGAPPTVRLHGEMVAIPGFDPLTGKDIEKMLYAVMSTDQHHRFETEKELDFAYMLPGQARFRVNVLRQQDNVGAVMRIIPAEIKSLDDLKMPEILGEFAALPRGFVLVTGPTGSGKSTTLAAIIDRANRTRAGHIITIEDPIEFIHQHRASIINQREVGTDTHGFQNALKHVLRQDPDIILVGELRDLETISVALTAAETGHLVFATLHTQSAQETITRIVDVFPAGQQQQVRTQLAASLQAVVCQTLCKTPDGEGRVAAAEIMVVDTGIRAMIRDDKLAQIPSALQAGKAKGNQTLNMHLAELVRAGKITWEEGAKKCSNAEDFVNLAGTREEAEAAARQATAQATTAYHDYGRL